MAVILKKALEDSSWVQLSLLRSSFLVKTQPKLEDLGFAIFMVALNYFFFQIVDNPTRTYFVAAMNGHGRQPFWNFENSVGKYAFSDKYMNT